MSADSEHRFQQGQGSGGVVAEVNLGNLHRFSGFDQRGKVHNAREVAVRKGRFQQFPVDNIAFDETRSLGKRRTPAVTKIVEDADFVTCRQQQPGYGSADVTGSPSYQNPHEYLILEMVIETFAEFLQQKYYSAVVHRLAELIMLLWCCQRIGEYQRKSTTVP